jgi:hypothetical protein
LEDAEIFFCELDRLEEAGELTDFGDLARSLDKLFALPDVEAGPEAVEIMIIHKAKAWSSTPSSFPGSIVRRVRAASPCSPGASWPAGACYWRPSMKPGRQGALV